MFTWFVKKVVCGKVNDLLDEYKDNVSKVKETLQKWISRIDKILFALRSLLSKLEDNQIDSDEIDQTVAEIEKVIAEW